MHRIGSKDSEIDPMNAPTRTVFFDHTKSDKMDQYGQKSSDDNTEKSISIKKQSQTIPKSLEKFADSKISDEKITDIKKKIELEKLSHSKVKKRLDIKSKSVKKAKYTLVETQKK